MVALSIRQPWAWAILHAGKDIENRTWKTSVRGRVYIHASKTVEKDDVAFLRTKGYQVPEGLPTGGIVGAVDITGWVTHSESEWFYGPIGFTLANPEAMPFWPCRGLPGFFEPKGDAMIEGTASDRLYLHDGKPYIVEHGQTLYTAIEASHQDLATVQARPDLYQPIPAGEPVVFRQVTKNLYGEFASVKYVDRIYDLRPMTLQLQPLKEPAVDEFEPGMLCTIYWSEGDKLQDMVFLRASRGPGDGHLFRNPKGKLVNVGTYEAIIQQ